jgi:DNA-binding NtrC family response regulator
VNSTKILIVDDEAIMRESLAGWLERDGHWVQTARSGEEALKKCAENRFDILLVDIKMEGMSGLDVLRRVKEGDSDLAVVMITAYGSIATAIEAMKNGAFDYMLKPFDPNELGVLVEKIIRHQQQARENLYLKEQFKDRTRFESMIGQSEPMQKVFNLICDVAPTDATVLILGETGTGKGLAAKAIHSNSPRRDGPYVVVNCGAIPEHLMESELFGHQRGAFTDAKETKKGRLEMAHGGTLFLDEIGEIGMRMQIDLLRVLEDRVFYRVGGTQPLEADFRVVAATNRRLEQLIREGRFRDDLYYRLNVVSFSMPSLKQRKEDIPLLAEHFLHRELENAIERAVVVGKGRQIMPEDLPILCHEPAPVPRLRTLEEIEKLHIHQILTENQWNIARSAKVLGIDRSTLYNKIKRYGVQKDA